MAGIIGMKLSDSNVRVAINPLRCCQPVSHVETTRRWDNHSR